jgi:hypothetical protein
MKMSDSVNCHCHVKKDTVPYKQSSVTSTIYFKKLHSKMQSGYKKRNKREGRAKIKKRMKARKKQMLENNVFDTNFVPKAR